MEPQRFDDLARALSRTPSRRTVLKGLVGMAAGGLAAAFGAREGEAARCATEADCPACQTCEPGRRGRPGRCVPNPIAEGVACADCGICQAGRCQPADSACGDCERCDRKSLTCESACRNNQVCCDGACRRPGDGCCAGEDDCNECQTCQNNRCVPDVNQGRECGDCKRCRDGECTEADPELLCDGLCCPEAEICVGVFDQECCAIPAVCKNILGNPVNCCRDGSTCTADDGCCPAGRQTCGALPAGNLGDPRFQECCDADETCLTGECCPTEQVCGGVCCPDGQSCANPSTSTCCTDCVDGACCAAGQICVDDGLFGADNFCCDAGLNQPCGDNGDGTFAACCSKANSECCGRECVPIGTCDCPSGQLTAAADLCCQNGPPCGDVCCGEGEECAGGLLCRKKEGCPEGETPCDNGEGGFFCCPAGEKCCNATCIPEADLCCDPGASACGPVCCGAEGCCGDACCCEAGTEYCEAADGGHTCCAAGTYCCDGACIAETETCCFGNGEACGAGCCSAEQGCCGEACCCAEGESHCGDDANGPICCGAGDVCCNDSCQPGSEPCCPTGQSFCGDGCIDTQADPLNCGGCGVTCASCEECQGGACVPGAEGCCSGDTQACGAACCTAEQGCCGSACCCPPGQTPCDDGRCVAVGASCCPAGTTDCGGACVSTQADPLNCGRCGASCAPGFVCCCGICTREGYCCSGGNEIRPCAYCGYNPQFPDVVWYCKISPNGAATCSSNP